MAKHDAAAAAHHLANVRRILPTDFLAAQLTLRLPGCTPRRAYERHAIHLTEPRSNPHHGLRDSKSILQRLPLGRQDEVSEDVLLSIEERLGRENGWGLSLDDSCQI